MAHTFGGPKSAQHLQADADLAEALAVLQTLVHAIKRDLMQVAPAQAVAAALLQKHSLVV